AANLNPARIIDLATLTGACVVALGNTASGLMSNNDELTEQLLSAGKRSTDRVWQLPLYDDYKDQVKSDVADVKNVGAKNKAGAVSAGAFLSHFVGEQPWAHIDIAGPAYLDEDKMYLGKGATGAGVRLLVDYLRHHNK
ncbi:MAG TPA: leucyl aminopeptidase, partial [Candidatus Nanoarchaeia archaeon]|nr:leucyl aminopeptidase [Candidatus Nanoarchaeia archaeon]